jgi:hypothetical protein
MRKKNENKCLSLDNNNRIQANKHRYYIIILYRLVPSGYYRRKRRNYIDVARRTVTIRYFYSIIKMIKTKVFIFKIGRK